MILDIDFYVKLISSTIKIQKYFEKGLLQLVAILFLLFISLITIMVTLQEIGSFFFLQQVFCDISMNSVCSDKSSSKSARKTMNLPEIQQILRKLLYKYLAMLSFERCKSVQNL